jgi:hypothetical protein
MMCRGAVLLVMVLLAPLALQRSTDATRLDPTQRNAIGEAVFRYQLAHLYFKNYSAFVELPTENGKWRDPDERFLSRLNDIKPRPRKFSERPRPPAGVYPHQFVDRGSGKVIVLLFVGAITRLSDSEVELDGGFSCGSLCGESFHYRVVNKADAWTVTEAKLTSVS